MSVSVTDEQVSAIADALGVGRDSKHVEAVLYAVRRYAARGPLTGGDHRSGDIETLRALARAMDGINPNVLGWLHRHGAEFDCGGDPRQIAAAAREAIGALERERPAPRSGPKRMDSRAALLRDLAETYAAAGCPRGAYRTFLRAAVAPIPALAPCDESLIRAAQRALRNAT